MALNLLKAGHTLHVTDLNANATALAQQAGAVVSEDTSNVARNSDLVITMLPTPQHVKSVYLGESGLLANARNKALLVDCSTIDPATARQIADAAEVLGNPFADAPVSGGTNGARDGTLTFMVGTSPSTFPVLNPTLLDMGTKVVHCGGPGTGQVAKVCNNLLLGISMVGVAEAMSLGSALGMAPEQLAEIINTSTGKCWSSESYNPCPGVVPGSPASRGYSGGFGVDLMLKDLGLATDAAKSTKQPLFVGAIAHQVYQLMSNQGHGDLDFSAVIKLYQHNH